MVRGAEEVADISASGRGIGPAPAAAPPMTSCPPASITLNVWKPSHQLSIPNDRKQ